MNVPDPTAGGAVPVAPDAGLPETVLRLEGVRKSFGDTVVLDGIDLDVHAHDVG